MLRIARALPLLWGVGAVSLWYATTGHGPWSAPGAPTALSLQFAAMGLCAGISGEQVAEGALDGL